MAILHTRPNEIFDLAAGPDGGSTGAVTRVLIRSHGLEVIRWELPAGHRMALHHAPGELTLLCLRGTAVVMVDAEPLQLSAGQLLYLSAGQPHAVEAMDDSVLLATVVLPAARPPADLVQEASEESFPASDSPAY